MENEQEKLTAFVGHVLLDAGSEASALMSEVEQARTKAMDKTENDILTDAYHYIRREVERIRTESGRRVSQKILKNKRAVAHCREELIGEVLSAVRARISDFTVSPDYLPYLMRQLKKVRSSLPPGRLTVSLALRDAALFPELQREFPEISFEATDSFELGGFIAVCPDTALRVEATFDSALADSGSHFAELIGLGISQAGGNRE